MANENIQELKFQVGEAWKGVYSSSTAYGLANVVQDPTGLSIYRSLKSGNVGHPLSNASWWFRIIDLSSIKAESDRIAALNQAIAQDEALRVAAEELRQQHEAERVAAETQRNEAEQQRISAEQARVNAESARATAEQQRITAEQGRVSAESARVQAEQARVLAETLRANAEDQRVANEQNRIAAEQQRIERAEQDHQRAESDHATYVDSLGAFDISSYHATDGVLAKYADLTAALGTGGANIPDDLRKGGMSVKFVQSSDNKYVQYFLTKDEWSASAADWQKMNLEEEVSQLDQEVDGKEGWKSEASISIYPGISTSSNTLYPFSKIIAANKTYTVKIQIQNNAIPNGALYLKNASGSTVGSTIHFENGTSVEISRSEDIKYASFSLTDRNIVASGDIIVSVIEPGSAIKGLKERVSDLEEEIVSANNDIDTLQNNVATLQDNVDTLQDGVTELNMDINGQEEWKSEASISIYPGISTSSNTLYPFSKIIAANKTYTVKIQIQNNAIPKGGLYLKNSAGTTIKSTIYFTDGYSDEISSTQDIVYASFSLTDANIVASGDIIVTFTELGSVVRGLKERVSDLENSEKGLKERVSDLENSEKGMGEIGDGGALGVKEIINTSRPYYFSQGWSNNDTFGYLDKMLNFVPEGSHFLIFTDIHLDYHLDWGLRQKQAIIMNYVQKRLLNCPVIFGGDFIGVQSTEIAAQKEMSWFADEYYGAFGAKFVPVLGDHDTDRVSGGLEQGSQLSEEYIYNTYFRPAYKYDAVADEIGIAAIDNVVFSDDATINVTKKSAWKNYMRMHYYLDDNANKIRIIVVQQGAKFRDIPDYYNASGVALHFICEALQSAPNDYQIVVISHEFQIAMNELASIESVWDRILFGAMTAYKNKSSFVLTAPYVAGNTEVSNVWSAIYAAYNNTNYNFADKTGSVVCLQGDEHFDYAGYYDNAHNMTHFADGVYVPTVNDVARISIDRAILPENRGFPASQFSNINFVLHCRRAKAETSGDVLLGTTNEVLFDIVTINEDGITLVRVGDTPVAGKIGLYPIFNDNTSYSVGDRVIYYDTDNGVYMVKAFEFTSPHSAGSWDSSEVDEVIITEPYIRTYSL